MKVTSKSVSIDPPGDSSRVRTFIAEATVTITVRKCGTFSTDWKYFNEEQVKEEMHAEAIDAAIHRMQALAGLR